VRHAVRSRRLGRSRSERAALVRSLAQALFRYERIQTTLPKAKEAQRAAEKLVTQAKRGTLAARRRVEAWLQDPVIVKVLFTEIAPRFAKRPGGYTRIIHAGIRHGDGAPMAVLELVERKPEPPKTGKAPKGTTPPTKPAAPAPKTAKPEKPAAPPSKKKPGGFMSGLRKLFKKDRPKKDQDQGE